jgi:prepilin-type N-terminal cleavage/methylation domain-containing protein
MTSSTARSSKSGLALPRLHNRNFLGVRKLACAFVTFPRRQQAAALQGICGIRQEHDSGKTPTLKIASENRPKPSDLSARGFSLLEMTVAVTLVAMMAVGLWSVFRISIRSWSRGTQFIDANQRHRSILNFVRKQLASTYGVLTPLDLQTGKGMYPIFSGAENSLRFISLSSLRFQDNPGLTLAAYEAVQTRTGDYALIEKEERFLGDLPDEENHSGVEEKTITIFDNLTSFAFEYFDPGDVENEPRWIKEWDGEKTKRLPAAVSMKMISRDAKGNSFTRYMVVPIAVKTADPRTNFLNMPGNIRRRPL